VPAISVIIITKNEQHNIADCISTAKLLSADIVVADSGSTDDTIAIARAASAQVIQVSWINFGDARNHAAAAANNDWIFALDADERITPSLADSIRELSLNNPQKVYGCKRQSYFLGSKISFGEWGKDKVYRLYNRNHVSWNAVPVHEELKGDDMQKELVNGHIDHYTVASDEEYQEKTMKYARLSAEKYFKHHKQATIEKRFLSPAFTFLKSYILLLGFLDGEAGLRIARASAYATWLKYHYLHELNSGRQSSNS